jgi:2-polyprenyl-3-methyl-5-hydroxy-6-metoxy-1,4-benzoquinol methylase
VRPYSRYQRTLDRHLLQALQDSEASLARLTAEFRRSEDRFERLETFVSDMVAALDALRERAQAAEASAASTAERVQQLTGPLENLESAARALPYMAGQPLERLHRPELGEVIGFGGSAGEAHAVEDPDAAKRGEYVAFEDVFRGPSEVVEEAQRPYVSLMEGHDPVLDVGCGRGEFLGLLAKAGIAARGVDFDEDMVRVCRQRGLSDVVRADGNDYLEGLQDSELGGVFAAQVIEHMAYSAWRRFAALSLVKLRPGGVLLFETVNPHRLASLKTFWVDPTHCHPIFPEVALVVCRILGFAEAYAFAPGGDDFERDRFTAPAYAVLARKGEAAPVDNP